MDNNIQRRDPKPEILRIEQLVGQVKTGDIKLPKFQRPFVWRRKEMLSLLDSVYKGYPIGSILLWFTKEKLASEKSIADLIINERADEYPTNYVLDGQQRLSTLCGALYWDGKDSKSQWNISFDLEKEKFIYADSETKAEYFPLNKLLDTVDYLDQVNSFPTAKKQAYANIARKLMNSIKDYTIAAVTIKGMGLNEVAPIFERINSTGRKLTIVDLMRAATWKDGFDLNDAVKSVKKSCKAKNFEGITELHVLRSIAAANNYSFNREDIDKLRDVPSVSLADASHEIIPAYQLAVDFLTRELPLSSIAYLPYALQLNFLVEFFRICPKPNHVQRKELKKWFWSTSFARHFASLNTNIITKDLEEFRNLAKGIIQSLTNNHHINHENFLNEPFVLNKAASLTFALLLAQKKPKSLIDGSAINIDRSLSQINRHEFHHLFPQAYLKSFRVKSSELNQHANICLLSSYNNKYISDTKPSIYFNEIITTLGSHAENVLESNFINSDCLNHALNDDFLLFIEARKKLISEEIRILTY